MTGRVAVNTDLNFVQGLMLHGAADLKKMLPVLHLYGSLSFDSE